MENKNINHAPMSVMLSASALLLSQSAISETVSPTSEKTWALEEVVVTAQRRSEKSQDIPMSITALSQDALEKMGFTNINDISDKVPTLSIQPDFEKASALKVYIRGVGQEKPANFERDNGVGIYLDDIYVGHGNALSSELNDIERIEVLAGPQGILYGRNTIGGAIKFISSKPTGEWGFKQKFDVGSFGFMRSVSTINFPEKNNVSSKVTLLRSHKDGWVDNLGNGHNPGYKDAFGLRAAFQWNPNDQWVVDYAYDRSDQDSISNYQQHGYPMFAQSLTALGVYPDREDKTWRPLHPDIKDDFLASGHALTAQWNINDNLSLKSITGYRDFESESLHDGAESYNVSTLVATEADQDQFSQEFLLSGNNEDSSIKYHVGLYYFDEEAQQRNSELISNYGIAVAINNALLSGGSVVGPQLSDLKPYSTFDIGNQSQAIYAQLTFIPNVFEQRITIDVGARYTKDDRSLKWNKPFNVNNAFEVDAQDSVSSDSFDPAITFDVAWTDDMHTYFRYAEAYRSGGYDTGSERLQDFGREDLNSYEVGLKSKFLDNRMMFNLSVFQLDYTDIQVQFFDPGLDSSQPPAKVTVNAAEAETTGAELEFKYTPTSGLLLSGGAAYLDSETSVTNPFTKVTEDRPLFNTPKIKYNLSAEYTFAANSYGEWSASLSYDFRDEELAAGSNDPDDLKPDYGLLSMRIGLANMDFANGSLNVALWGKNLTDEEYEIYHNYGSVIYGEPQSFGVSFNYKL